jgi:PmbA protein
VDITEQLPGMARRPARGGFLAGLAQQSAEMLAIGDWKARQEFREGGVALGEQPIAPTLAFLEPGLRSLIQTLEPLQGGADGCGVQLAHESTDVLALTLLGAVAGDAAREHYRVPQSLRQVQFRQLRFRQAHQFLAQILQGVHVALALRLAGPLGDVIILLHARTIGVLDGLLRAMDLKRVVTRHDTPSASEAELRQLLQDVLREARAQGASQAEAGVSVDAGLTLTVRLGEIETLEYQKDRGLGVTVYFGKRKGSASTSDLSPTAWQETVRAAAAIARYTAEDDCSGLADAELMARILPDLDLCHPWELEPEEAIDVARRCEDAARSYDPRIENSEGATVTTHRGTRVYGNSHGFAGGYESTSHSITCSVIGREGESMQRDYWYTTARDAADMESAEAVGRHASERTVARLGARRLGTRKAPVLFAPDVARGLVGHFLGAMRGGAQYRQASFLLGGAGQQVFPDFVQMSERPFLPKGLASAAFDNEGVATRDQEIVNRGVAAVYLLDSYSACKLGLKTNAHAGGVHNLLVKPGELDFTALLRKMDTGLLVTELLGQGVNGVTGDYSRGAAGFWVEHGSVQFPVEEVTVAGNLKDIYRGIVAVGNDVDLRGGVRTGSILVGEMTIAGQ